MRLDWDRESRDLNSPGPSLSLAWELGRLISVQFCNRCTNHKTSFQTTAWDGGGNGGGGNPAVLITSLSVGSPLL